ncbi:ADP-ribosylglycohydrolase family protein [Bacteroides rodentium]|uniref:ADP-ribosylglycohydrolase family protein n=1 Tax=Bacteroides rodentium TaxID=691816 RepID=UPI0010084E53|nr:ADP-ribosylglycohydrolase family protein [Bacteroides rodentium]
MSKVDLEDKIKGGWAGQTIGVTFGGSTEFKYNGTYIQDYQQLSWSDDRIKNTMLSWPDLYDDLYMDLTFVEIFERLGLEAPIDSFAYAFANADYMLWHANQAARYNILNGVLPPLSGHWLNNPHADDIDYQIEADFAGLMSPGMPNAASDISDKIGHIMCYGDGWYGGVYVGAMYSLAFVYNDIYTIVTEALKTIPEQSTFHQCISDVIRWYKEYPEDWHQTWFEIQKKWSEDLACPEGVFVPFNIDAKVNAAYVVMGLLYGNGDFTETLEISTRAGQDSDCNPSTAGGILATMIGYDKIPAYWKNSLSEAEQMEFKYTNMSLEKIYVTSFKHALLMIERNGGIIKEDSIGILVQDPEKVRFEQSFSDLRPKKKETFWHPVDAEISFEFEGTGFAWRGEAAKNSKEMDEYIFEVTFYIDNKEVERCVLPTSYKLRKHDLLWKYNLPAGKHKVKMVINNPHPDYKVYSWDYIIF